MSDPAQDFCRKAIACLKAEVTGPDGPVIELEHADSPVLRPLGNGLLVAYLVDQGASFGYVQERHLEQAGISADDLHRSALQNLATLAEERAEVRAHGSIFAVLLDGHFEASLMLFEDFWQHWYAGLVPNGAVVALPARDVLAFADVGSATALAELRQVCQRSSGQAGHRLTDTLYRRVNDTWEPVDETADRPLMP